MKFYLRGRLSNGSKSCLTRHVHSPISVSIGSFERPLVMVGVSGKIWLKFSILSHSLRVDLINFFSLLFGLYPSVWYFLLSYQTDILDLF